MPTRRDFLKIVGITMVPLPGFVLGNPVTLYLSLTHHGEEVTERVPVGFRWNHKMTIRIGEGHNFTTDGLALFEGAHQRHPLRVKEFPPIRVTPALTLDVSYVLRNSQYPEEADV